MDELQRLVRVAARALGRSGLAHAYGHCSARIDAERFLVCAAKPMGMILPGDAGAVVPVNGPLPDGVLGEVRIHQQIYQRHPEISGVCRAMPAKTMSLSCLRRTPRPLHGPGCYFGPDIPLWDDPQLLRSDAQAAALADAMGACPTIVMRGNGAVTAADSLPAAVVLMWYLEDAARVELDILKTDVAAQAAVMSAEDAARRATRSGGIFERMWDYLCDGDPEYVPFRSG